MVQFDMTDTEVARRTTLIRMPTETELLAVTLGLMLAENCEFRDLLQCSLTLTPRNQHRVAAFIEQRFPPLARELGGSEALRRRVGQLVGLRITRQSMLL